MLCCCYPALRLWLLLVSLCCSFPDSLWSCLATRVVIPAAHWSCDDLLMTKSIFPPLG